MEFVGEVVEIICIGCGWLDWLLDVVVDLLYCVGMIVGD